MTPCQLQAHAQPHPSQGRPLRPAPRTGKTRGRFRKSTTPAVASVMSWAQAASSIPSPADEEDVFDEEADESLLVQREWRNHMQRRVKVNLGRGCGDSLGSRVEGRNARSCEEALSRVVPAWPAALLMA